MGPMGPNGAPWAPKESHWDPSGAPAGPPGPQGAPYFIISYHIYHIMEAPWDSIGAPWVPNGPQGSGGQSSQDQSNTTLV